MIRANRGLKMGNIRSTRVLQPGGRFLQFLLRLFRKKLLDQFTLIAQKARMFHSGGGAGESGVHAPYAAITSDKNCGRIHAKVHQLRQFCRTSSGVPGTSMGN